MTADLSHIAINEAEGKADCSVCQIGVTAPPSFGGVPRANMLAAFVVQHSVHKDKRPTGLTPTGRASKSARAHLGDAS
jgi:hypothetical protein